MYPQPPGQDDVNGIIRLTRCKQYFIGGQHAMAEVGQVAAQEIARDTAEQRGVDQQVKNVRCVYGCSPVVWLICVT